MDKTKLVQQLNKDLANELTAIIQYITYSAQVTGPYRPQLSAFLLQEVADEQGHAQFLANKIVVLGGLPTTVPNAIPVVHSNKEILEEVLKAEMHAIQSYTQRIEEALAFGDKSLALNLEDMLRDETGHKEEIEQILKNWSA